MKHSSAVIGTKKEELPIPVTELVPHKVQTCGLVREFWDPEILSPILPVSLGCPRCRLRQTRGIFMEAGRSQLLFPAAFQTTQIKQSACEQQQLRNPKSNSQPGIHSRCSPWLSSPVSAPKSLHCSAFSLPPSLLYLLLIKVSVFF